MTTSSTDSSIMDRPSFVDRKEEIEIVLKGLRSANNKRGGMVLVEGEAGIGKSRFIEECAHEARNIGYQVLQGRCLDYRKVPYLPFIEIARDYFGISLDRLEKEDMEKLANSIAREFPEMVEFRYDLIDFFFPHDLILGSYRSDRKNDAHILKELRNRGYRIFVLGDMIDIEDSIDPTITVMKIGSEEKGSLNPKRIERIAAAMKGYLEKYRHCAILFNGFDQVLGENPTPKTEKLVKVVTDLSKKNDGAMIFSTSMIDSKVLEGLPLLDHTCSGPASPINGQVECLEIERKGISPYELLPRFFREISKRNPILIVLEDLQWSEKSTHNLIQFLSREVREERIMIIGSYRSEESTIDDGLDGQASLRDNLRRMSREHLFTTIKLERFDQERSMELAAAILGHEMNLKHTGTMMRETGGNPRFIVDFMKRTLELEVTLSPEAASDVKVDDRLLAKRVHSLDENERLVLEMAAVIGESITMEKLSASLELGVESVLDALDSLIELKFLRESGDLFDFEQPMVRDLILDGIQPDIRKLMHKRVAQVLSDESSRKSNDEGADLAVHHFYSGEYENALDELVKKCEVQMDEGNLDNAMSTLELAKDCLEHMEDHETRSREWTRILTLEGDIHDNRGDHEKGISSFRKAIEIADKEGFNNELPVLLRRFGDLLMTRFDWDTSTENYLRSLHLSKRSGNEKETALTFKGLGRIYLLKGEYNRAIECYVKYMEYPGTRSGPGHVKGLTEMGDIYYQIGDFNQSLAYYKLAVQMGEENSLHNETSLAHIKMAHVLLRLGEVEESRRFGDLAHSQVQGKEPSLASIETLLIYADLMLELGELEKAEEVVKDLEGSIDSMDRLMRSTAYRVKGMMMSRQRDFKGSILQMKAAVSTLEEIDIPFDLGVSYYNFGLIRFQQMDVEGALEMLKKASGIFKGIRSMYYLNRTSSKIREVSFIREGLMS
ncbi:MAG: ATP-binding protein [Thermoplasmatota archaeon]